MIPTRHSTTTTSVFSSYWENPKSYLNTIKSANINLLAANAMVPYYFEVDDLGDAVAEEYLVEMGFRAGMGKLHQILKTYPLHVETYSENTQRFLQQIFHIPDWLDADLLNEGTNFCNRSGTSGLATLRNYSLMGGYESAAINKPLIFTEALKKVLLSAWQIRLFFG
ncbi:hypothetical protein K5I29_05820 [Flavobacterium agricola]|uniref:Uncharacterized protein n=1 Tax=Flavobacterium agricola TaxID=2870839 RepID=A0ABY6M1K0_9FLAO|nr:hypothetical protein [Flavobacterium agricola]UYW02411.1 hypothetical protein K5I29_05820 [Flavobacterium agricola]